MRTKKAGSGGVLRRVDDTCHGSRSTQNRKLAFLVLHTSGTTPSRQPHQSGRSHHCCRRSFRPGDVRLVVQRLRCSPERSETLRVSFNEAAIYSSTSHLGLDAERLLTDDVRSTRCSWQRWKNFELCSWTWNIPARSMTASLLKELTSDRGIDYRASDQRHWEGLEGHALSSGEDFQQWKFRTLKPVLRFPFVSKGREGVENEIYVLRFASFCELLRRPLIRRSSPQKCKIWGRRHLLRNRLLRPHLHVGATDRWCHGSRRAMCTTPYWKNLNQTWQMRPPEK